VEQYGEHSRAVWEASKVRNGPRLDFLHRYLTLEAQFWKHFFEASANVSLSSNEELVNDEDTTAEETIEHDETASQYAASSRGDHTMTPGSGKRAYRNDDESFLTDGDGDLTGSTPRPPATKTIKPQFADMDSPYENLKRELTGKEATQTQMDMDESTESQLLAERTARLPDMSMTPHSSLDHEADEALQSTARKSKDPLLHRLLDKNYRIKATPHKTPHGISPIRWKVSEKAKADEKAKVKVPSWQDSSPMSSPEMAVPKLRSEAFMSPVRAAYRNKLTAAATGPRTPGISVQTPATSRKTRDVFGKADASAGPASRQERDEITWESDSDDAYDLHGGISPPKTIQFALPPSKLLQTPGKSRSAATARGWLANACRQLGRPASASWRTSC
jgi:DASH complex subunit ASK1